MFTSYHIVSRFVDTNQHMSLGPSEWTQDNQKKQAIMATRNIILKAFFHLYCILIKNGQPPRHHFTTYGKTTGSCCGWNHPRVHASNTSFLMRFGSAEGAPQEKRAMDYDSAAIRAITQRNDPLKGRFFPVIFFWKTQ